MNGIIEGKMIIVKFGIIGNECQSCLARPTTTEHKLIEIRIAPGFSQSVQILRLCKECITTLIADSSRLLT